MKLKKDAPEFDEKIDHCTGVAEKLFGVSMKPACYYHDRQYRNEVVNRKTRRQADIDFRNYIIILYKRKNKPVLGWIISRVRYLGVRLFGGYAWQDGN